MIFCSAAFCVRKSEKEKEDKTRNGNKLKKPVIDSVFTCAMHIDTEYSKPEKTAGGYEWRSSLRDLNMETEFYKVPRKYTEKNIAH